MRSPSKFVALKRLLDANDWPFVLPLPPWSDPGDRTVRHIRRAARTALRRRELARRGWLPFLCSAAGWPLLSLVKAWREARRGFRIHPGLLVSVLDAWWLQLGHNLRIADLQYHRLDQPEARRKVRRYVTDGENKYLLETINRGQPSAALCDKRAFADFCTRHDLPAPAVLSRSSGDGPVVEHLRDWPAADLILKPSNAWGGQNIRILRHDPDQRVWHAEGAPPITPENVGPVVHQLLRGEPWLLQPRLRNGPEFADLVDSPDAALATVRVVTGRLLPEGPVEVVAGFMRFPLRASVVDNLCAGGIGADYDPITGILGTARHLYGPTTLFTHHPTTGGAIAGRKIPRWEEIAALACRAHGLVPDIATLGWDVALTPDGPILIETNPNWGVPLDMPLGDTSYARFLLQPALRHHFSPTAHHHEPAGNV